VLVWCCSEARMCGVWWVGESERGSEKSVEPDACCLKGREIDSIHECCVHVYAATIHFLIIDSKIMHY
jgi:hypothetical protein